MKAQLLRQHTATLSALEQQNFASYAWNNALRSAPDLVDSHHRRAATHVPAGGSRVRAARRFGTLCKPS